MNEGTVFLFKNEQKNRPFVHNDGADYMETFFPRDDGICMKIVTHIVWES